MRTRIALVAIFIIAFITVSTLGQAATASSAQADITSSSRTVATPARPMPSNRLADYRHPAVASVPAGSGLLLDPTGSLLFLTATPTSATAPAPPPPPPAPAAQPAPPAGPVDTVTPGEREEWEQVALCEEGGNWNSDGPEFSGGLGITRANWAAYGGEAFAPEGAMATEDQQIMVAERIEFSPPDQGGCHGW
jgi:hypothetical protein